MLAASVFRGKKWHLLFLCLTYKPPMLCPLLQGCMHWLSCIVIVKARAIFTVMDVPRILKYTGACVAAVLPPRLAVMARFCNHSNTQAALFTFCCLWVLQIHYKFHMFTPREQRYFSTDVTWCTDSQSTDEFRVLCQHDDAAHHWAGGAKITQTKNVPLRQEHKVVSSANEQVIGCLPVCSHTK